MEGEIGREQRRWHGAAAGMAQHAGHAFDIIDSILLLRLRSRPKSRREPPILPKFCATGRRWLGTLLAWCALLRAPGAHAAGCAGNFAFKCNCPPSVNTLCGRTRRSRGLQRRSPPRFWSLMARQGCEKFAGMACEAQPAASGGGALPPPLPLLRVRRCRRHVTCTIWLLLPPPCSPLRPL